MGTHAAAESRTTPRRRPPAVAVPVSPAMLEAGRAAFLRRRAMLDDLWSYFDSDLDRVLLHIYREMHARALP